MVTVAMISDFFFPNVGGVEAHLYSLAFCLRKQGHKVIILTREREDFNLTGVRYYSNDLKVYYISCPSMPSGIILPCIISCMSFLIRDIMIREKVQVMHGHQSTSLLAIIAAFIATCMEIPYVLTQHSLHEFGDLASIELNNLYAFMSKYNVARTICVSNTVRENVILRHKASEKHAIVIPNAIDFCFYSKRELPQPKNPSKVRIIFLTRMTFRKGIDLFLEVMPVICKRFKHVQFLVCGDGPKRNMIEHVVREFSLESQVEFKGFAAIEDVPYIYSSGDIFLCTSISEAFCLAILEAAACGSYVISTDVGGISEILPKEAISLCNPTASDLIDKLVAAIEDKKYLNLFRTQEVIEESYSWDSVASEVSKVYTEVLTEQRPVDWVQMVKEVWSGMFNFGSLIFLFMLTNVLFFVVEVIFGGKSRRMAVHLDTSAASKKIKK